MNKRIMALILVALLLTGCASQAGTNTASNMGGTISISDFESELESTSSSVTSESEAESEPTTSAEATKKPAETTTKPVEVTKKPAETTTKKSVESKPETTSTPATTKASTTTASATKPAPEWTETKVSGTKYINTDCYSRKKAVLGAETVKIYNVNDKVKVVAKTNTGYFKLDTGAFVHGDYLSDSKIIIQTTVATTTKKQETPKPAAPTPKPSASADPVDEVYYANNAPAIDEEWLIRKFPEYVRVKDTYPSSPDKVPSTADDRGWGTGIWLDKTITVGKDIPEGWYLCQVSNAYIPAKDAAYYTRSAGYTSDCIIGEAHYFKSGDKIYCTNMTDTGEKVSKLAYLMPISNGYTDAGKIYYKGKLNSPHFAAVIGKGNKYEPGKYKVKLVKEFDVFFNQYLCYASLYSAVYDKIYADYADKDNKIITLTAGDVVTGYDVELIKIS